MKRGKYTVHEVEERTNVPAGTLRQWERRYDCPLPERSDSGYRLYSEADIRAIERMKRHIADGIPASRAAELVKEIPAETEAAEGRPTTDLRDALVECLVELDDEQADRVLGEAHALHPVEAVLTEVIGPAMIELGQRWHDGKLLTTTEHFASSYVQGRLRTLLSLSGHHRRSPTVVVACAPLDQHELGALMLAVLLRRRGYRATYLGANTPVADLAAMARDQRPLGLMISASSVDSIQELREARQALNGAAPILVFGGAAFNQDPAKAVELGGRYLSDNVLDAVQLFDELAATTPASASG